MKNAYSLFALAVLLAGSACSSTREQAAPVARNDLRQFTPLALLNHLKTDTRPMRVFTVEQPIECWVSEKDVPYLIARLSSNEASMSVALSVVSNIRKSSREADEAAYLIQGYRAGKYPPTLGSEPVSAEEIAEIRSWWTSHKAGRVPKESGVVRCEQKH